MERERHLPCTRPIESKEGNAKRYGTPSGYKEGCEISLPKKGCFAVLCFLCAQPGLNFPFFPPLDIFNTKQSEEQGEWGTLAAGWGPSLSCTESCLGGTCSSQPKLIVKTEKSFRTPGWWVSGTLRQIWEPGFKQMLQVKYLWMKGQNMQARQSRGIGKIKAVHLADREAFVYRSGAVQSCPGHKGSRHRRTFSYSLLRE